MPVNVMRIVWSKITDGERGRPPSPWHSYYDKRLFTYVTRISQKHGISLDKFLQKIVEARENEKSKSACKTLTIQCRGKTKNHAVFRITKKGSLVAQLRIPNYLLDTKDKLKDKSSISQP
ncbi:hypothetical protein [Candidatus Hecatella orcuttiae]|jgi:predicted ATP-grasp superfamily ATP-dependent carboligase|uniref:hypothetical protein n=1 Tax=Candidatus Hecatella orcuttiae TaxID=1935119 RepID=UPI0028683A2D|nr:hypothetical protein [Candidatus Hecatella orcuttiae]